MAPGRNRSRNKVVNANEQYEEVLDSKKVVSILQYDTPVFTMITPEQRVTLTRVKHIWKTGDRFYKLASKHYGDPKLWWVIAWYNTTPTEAHVKVGHVIRVPFPIERVMRLLRVY